MTATHAPEPQTPDPKPHTLDLFYPHPSPYIVATPSHQKNYTRKTP